MKLIEYENLSNIDPKNFLPLLNSQKVRNHLIAHDQFDLAMVQSWIETKQRVDDIVGCKVRAVLVDQHLAGWCGIQLENKSYELAIVLDQKYWGVGKKIFSTLMNWAEELGHKTVTIHLLDTRPEYTFLKKIAYRTYQSEIFDQKFNSYQLKVLSHQT